MRRYVGLMCCLLAMTMFSCGGKQVVGDNATVGSDTKVYAFADSCSHLTVSLSLELPAGSDSMSAHVRDSLVAEFICSANMPDYLVEDAGSIKPYEGDRSDIQTLVNHYGKELYDHLLALAMADYKERMEYLDEDTTMSVEEKNEIRKDTPQWAFDFSCKKTTEAERYVVYSSQAYVYYGGAHGGVTGTGAMTFDRTTGRKIQHFVRPDATEALQPLFSKGLLRYYAECYDTITETELMERLQIEGSMIPQPQSVPFPNAAGDSLVFCYGQYEIACYADGSPSFTLALKDLTPYLTKEATSICQPRRKP